MKLTLQTDYALRILISLAGRPDQCISVQELSDHFNVSKNHLMKTAQILNRAGYIKTDRGRNGGLRLALPAQKINIGEIIKIMEPNFYVAECFQKGQTGKLCALLPNCRLKGLLGEALSAFIDVVDQKTLADLLD